MVRVSSLLTAIMRSVKAAFSYVRNRAIMFVYASKAGQLMSQTASASKLHTADEPPMPAQGPSLSYQDSGSPVVGVHSVDLKDEFDALATQFTQLDLHFNNLRYDIEGAVRAVDTNRELVSTGLVQMDALLVTLIGGVRVQGARSILELNIQLTAFEAHVYVGR